MVQIPVSWVTIIMIACSWTAWKIVCQLLLPQDHFTVRLASPVDMSFVPSRRLGESRVSHRFRIGQRESAPSKYCEWALLPPAVLALVFAYLPVNMLFVCRLVCTTWRDGVGSRHQVPRSRPLPILPIGGLDDSPSSSPDSASSGGEWSSISKEALSASSGTRSEFLRMLNRRATRQILSPRARYNDDSSAPPTPRSRLAHPAPHQQLESALSSSEGLIAQGLARKMEELVVERIRMARRATSLSTRTHEEILSPLQAPTLAAHVLRLVHGCEYDDLASLKQVAMEVMRLRFPRHVWTVWSADDPHGMVFGWAERVILCLVGRDARQFILEFTPYATKAQIGVIQRKVRFHQQKTGRIVRSVIILSAVIDPSVLDVARSCGFDIRPLLG